jgi:protein gp37
MGDQTKIEWTATYLPDGTVIPGATFNPWIGCTRLSEGCRFCYAEQLMDKRYGKVEWGPQGERKRTSDAYWRQPLKWNREAEAQGIRRKVFCASLADVFEDRRGQDALTLWRAQLWYLIEQTPNLDWLLLTKRPENILTMTPQYWRNVGKWPGHVWIGTSVEDQANADKRIPHLLNVPARIRFLSAEPLLGPVSLDNGESSWLTCDGATVNGECCESYTVGGSHFHGIDWVIVGGESGSYARPMQETWALSIVEQCRAAGVAPFVKQMGTVWAKQNGASDTKGGDWSEWPEEFRVREFPTSEAAHATA